MGGWDAPIYPLGSRRIRIGGWGAGIPQYTPGSSGSMGSRGIRIGGSVAGIPPKGPGEQRGQGKQRD